MYVCVSLCSWTLKSPLPQPVCHACIVEVHDTLLLVGGSNVLNWGEPVESLPSVMRYVEDGDYWVLYQTLAVPRHDADCCVLGASVSVSVRPSVGRLVFYIRGCLSVCFSACI